MKSKKQTKKQSNKVEVVESIDKVVKEDDIITEKVKQFRSFNYDDNSIAALLMVPVDKIKNIK